MNIFSKIQDWATGNSINFETEAKVYAEITEAMQNLAEKLEIAINNNRIESEALIQQKCFEISLIQAEMNNILKNSIGMDLNEKKINESRWITLQEKYCLEIEKTKQLIIDNILNCPELDEIYWILIELKKIIISNLQLPAIKDCGYIHTSQIPNYNQLKKLESNISKRKIEIIPYLGKLNKK